MIAQPKRDNGGLPQISRDALAKGLVFVAAGACQLTLSHPLPAACALLHAALLLLSGQPWLHAAGFAVATVQVASGGLPFAALYFPLLLGTRGLVAASTAIAAVAVLVWLLPSHGVDPDSLPLLCALPACVVLLSTTERQRDAAEAVRSTAASLDSERKQLERELSIAHRIQSALLPRSGEEIPGWRAAFRFMPAREVGGDLVQFLRDDDRLGVVVADIAGKGIPAAILVGSVHQLLHRVGHLPLEDMLADLNASLCATTPDDISVAMTVVWVSPATGRVRYAVAGAPPPLIVRGGERIEMLEGGDLALGWLEQARFSVHGAELEKGDTLVIYTDGLTDSTHGGTRLDLEGAVELIEQARRDDVDEMATAIETALRCRQRTDDTCFVLMRRTD